MTAGAITRLFSNEATARSPERARSVVVDPVAREQGFALLLVIWILALLAVLAASVASDSRSEATIARNRLESAKARALADAGVALAVAGLVDPNPATQWHADGQSRTIQYGDQSIDLVVQDEGGKIDLNNAPPELIAGLFDEFGVAADARTMVVAGIAQRRQEFATAKAPAEQSLMTGNTLSDRLQRVNAGLPVPSPFAAAQNSSAGDVTQQPFADLSELRLIPGMTRGIYDQLQPYLTIYSGIPTINPLTSAREVLLAIPGIAEQDVEFWLSSRDKATGIEKPPLSGADRYAQVTTVRAATITAKVVTGTGATFSREAVVTISPLFPLQPFRILRWRQPAEPANSNDLARR